MANVNFTSFSANTSPSLSANVVGYFGNSVGAEQSYTLGVIVALVAANLSLTSANISNFNTAAAAAAPVQSVAGQTGNVSTIPAANVSGLATVATTGSYNDLNNRPTLGTAAATNANAYATAAQGALADTAVQPGDLATVATTGAYGDLSGTPTIPNAIFFRVAVAGESNVDANSATDVLTLVEGANMNITTNATAKTITFAATGGGGGGGGLADPGANGIVIRTAENVTTARTIIGGNGVTVDNGNGVAANVTVSVANASTSVLGIVQLANSVQTTAGLAVQASDSRLSDARTPTSHASTHTAADPIRDATASQNGLMTAAYAAKLDGIPADATNNAGTVTSVNANGTTTGLTFSNGPITNSGTLDLAGVLVAAHGGTGRNTHTANAVLIGNGTGAINNVAPGSNGNVLTSNGTTWISQAPTGGGGWATGILFTSGSTTAQIDNSTAETSIFSGTIPGGTLGTSGAVRFVLSGQFLNDTAAGQGFTLRIKYGATTLYQDATNATWFASSSIRRTWRIEGHLVSDGSASAQRVEFRYYSGNPVAATTGYGDAGNASTTANLDFIGGGTASENSAGDLTFDVTIQLTTASTFYEWYTYRAFAAKV